MILEEITEEILRVIPELVIHGNKEVITEIVKKALDDEWNEALDEVRNLDDKTELYNLRL